MHNVEVDEKPDALPAELQVRKDLRMVNLVHLRYCFYFDDNVILDQQINPIRGLEHDTVVVDR